MSVTSKTISYPSVWPCAKARIQLTRNRQNWRKVVVFSHFPHKEVRLCEFTLGTWAKEARDTSEEDELQGTQLLSCLNLKVFYSSSGLSCLSLCQHSQNLVDKQKVHKVHQMLPYPILVCLNAFLLISYHFWQNLHWYSVLQLISSRKRVQKKMTSDKRLRTACQKHLCFIFLCLGLRFICYAGKA